MYPQGGGISQIVADVGTATHSMAQSRSARMSSSDETSRATKAFKEHYAHCKAQEGTRPGDYTMVQRMVFGSDDNGAQIGGSTTTNIGSCRQKDRICEASPRASRKDKPIVADPPRYLLARAEGHGYIKMPGREPGGVRKVIWNLGYNCGCVLLHGRRGLRMGGQNVWLHGSGENLPAPGALSHSEPHRGQPPRR